MRGVGRNRAGAGGSRGRSHTYQCADRPMDDPSLPRRGLGFAWMASAFALTLASCVSPEEFRREDEATCTSYGFDPGTDAFASCLQKESLARRYWAAPPPPYWGWGSWGWGGPRGSYWP